MTFYCCKIAEYGGSLSRRCQEKFSKVNKIFTDLGLITLNKSSKLTTIVCWFIVIQTAFFKYSYICIYNYF